MTFIRIEKFGFAIAMLALALLLGIGGGNTALAQVAGATLSGLITDSSGAAIANAKVSIKNVATGTLREVNPNSDGFFTAPNLLPGEYEVTVSAVGFSTAVQQGINLTVGAEQAMNVTLQVGQVTDKVVVSGGTPTIELSTSTVSGHVDSTTVRELPLNGRDWTTLATLEPGVVSIRTQASTGSSSNRGNRGFGNQLSANGHRPNENTYRINGININDYSNGAPGSVLGVNLGVDAIQEFTVLTTNYTAEYGRTSGAVINAITRSGTNQMHGGAYFFDRDKIFDAKNFFDDPSKPIPPFRRIQFGGSGGGAIIKDRTFIFGDYEGVRQNVSTPLLVTVPSENARSGRMCPTPGEQAGCVAHTLTIDPAARKALDLWPRSSNVLTGKTANGDLATLSVSAPQVLTENYLSARVDQKIGEKDSLANSYLFDQARQTQPDDLANAIHKAYSRRQMVSAEETHIFSSAFVNSFRAGYNRVLGIVNTPVTAPNPVAMDPSLRAVPRSGFFVPQLNVQGGLTGAAGLGAPSFFNHAWTSIQLNDDAFWVRGTHSFKFGFAFERMQSNLLGKFRQNGFFQFTTLDNFLLNRPSNFNALDPDTLAETGSRQSLFGGYVQDDWRARSNLTLNLGLRYEMVTLPSDSADRFWVVQSLQNCAASLTACTQVPVKTLWADNPTLKNFEPRIGLSWDPFGSGKTAIRAGFGIFDVFPLPYVYTQYNSSSFPFNRQASTSTNLNGTFPNGPVAGGNPTYRAFNSLNFRDLRQLRSRYVEQSPHRSYAMNWNLNIQRQITSSWMAMIGYVGSRSLHLSNTADDSNMVLPEGHFQGRPYWPKGTGTRIDPNVGEIRPLIFDGASTSHGFQAQSKKSMQHGFQIQGSYTWGKCLDTGTTGTVGDMFLNSIRALILFERSARQGPCDFNVAHSFVLNYLWQLPGPKAGGLRWILGGWEFGGIVSASTGTPFTVRIDGDPLGQRNIERAAVPDRLPGCDPINHNFKNGSSPFYLNVNCFALPTAPTGFTGCQVFGPSFPGTCRNLLGNSGRNQLYGPGLINFDLSLSKNTKFTERFNAQFRAEFFNIFNHPNFQAPLRNNRLFLQDGSSISTGGLLDSTTTASRQIQLGLKLVW